jgi:hypothetical protein
MHLSAEHGLRAGCIITCFAEAASAAKEVDLKRIDQLFANATH